MGKKRSLEEISALAKTIYPKFNVTGEIYRKNRRYVVISCGECGNTFERQPNATDLNHDCPYCDGFRVNVGVNDIASTDTWLVPYFKDRKDAYRYSRGNSGQAKFKCPDCGYEYKRVIKDMTRYGWSCPCCSDGISKPNKFLHFLLGKINVDNVQYEYRSEWTCNKIFDAYFEYGDRKFVIEMDGDQHQRGNGWTSFDEQKENDLFKNKLALENGITIVRIATPYNKYEYWIDELKCSELADLLTDIDWKECIKFSEGNLVKEVCKYYEEHPNAIRQEICDVFNLSSKWTVTNYLGIGAKLGWCHYSPSEIKDRFDRFNRKRRGIKTRIYDDKNVLIANCDSMTDCVNKLNSIFHMNKSREWIRGCLRHKTEYYFNGYKIEMVQGKGV